MSIEVSRPEKVLYPRDGLTKSDVAEHYRAVAPAMLPHLSGRPLTLRRFPDGIDEQGWFQKEASGHFPDWIRVEQVPQRTAEGEVVHHVVCEDENTLLYLADQATLEFHVFPSTMDSLDHPDLVVVDLDPSEATENHDLRRAVREVRDLFLRVGLTPYPQATGGRGFHVVAPLDRSAPDNEVREFARAAADHLAEQHPDRLTTAQRKDKRGGRLFLDTNRNAYGQTLICPYSLRARHGAGAATPLDFQELDKAAPSAWTPEKVRRRLARKSDPWSTLRENAAPVRRAREELHELE